MILRNIVLKCSLNFYLCVSCQAKQQLNLRTHMADENKNEYAAQLQNFNGEQHKHFYIVIPQIYKVNHEFSF